MKGAMDRLPLRERNRQRTFQRIIDAALELFGTIGYDQTTMDAIAEKAEVSRGTLFNYFSSKSALLMPYAGRLYLERVQPEMRSHLDAQPTTLQALRFLFMSIHEHILTLPDMYRALQQEFLCPQPVAKEAGIGFFENLLTILQYGQQRGEVRCDIASENLAHYVGVLYVSLLRHDPIEARLLANYAVEIDILLAFIGPALLPVRTTDVR